MNLPAGTLTFLFTDIEGSTRLWEQHPIAMQNALTRHDTLLRENIERHQGIVFKTVGDAFCAVFVSPGEALRAALSAQTALLEPLDESLTPLRVRMALHTGNAAPRDGDYFGDTLNRTARLLSIGYGGQTLVSETTESLLRERPLPSDIVLTDRGLYRLRDLSQPIRVYEMHHPRLPKAFPPLRSLDNTAYPNNLPHQLTSFIGREKEMEAIVRLLSAAPLLTLTGSGGCGKTRLALQTAAECVADYPDGVWLIELAPISEAEFIPQAVAQVLSVREEPGRPLTETLSDYLLGKRLLLLLDNCEHLLEAVANFLAVVRRIVPALRVLVTSRAPLQLSGETLYRVPSLAMPSLRRLTPAALQQCESVRLFVERAMLHRPTFTLTAENAAPLAEVCTRLDGIPFAIELAAARMRVLSIEEISCRLDDRFRLLTGGNRTALPRQQTLRATLDWSYDLLSEAERLLLVRLSVFAGGFTLDAAEQVCAMAVEGTPLDVPDVFEVLLSLVDKSLVQHDSDTQEGRYRLLETIREYGQERLAERDEQDALRRAHRGYYLAYAERLSMELYGAEQASFLERIATEHDNLRAALQYSLSSDEQDTLPFVALRFCLALGRFWEIRGYLSEGTAQIRAALSATSGAEELESVRVRAQVLDIQGRLSVHMGDYAEAARAHQDSLKLYRRLGDMEGIASALNLLGNTAYYQSDYATARNYYEQCLAIQRQRKDARGILFAFGNLGNIAHSEGRFADALHCFEESLGGVRQSGDQRIIAHWLTNMGMCAYALEAYVQAQNLLLESLAISRTLGDRRSIATVLDNLGMVAFAQEDYGRAQELHTESLILSEEQGDRWSIAYTYRNLGELARVAGDLSEALRLFRESLTIYRTLDYPRGIAGIFECFAGIYAETTPEYAAQLWGAADVIREDIRSPIPANDRKRRDEAEKRTREALGEEGFAALYATGRTLSFSDVVLLTR